MFNRLSIAWKLLIGFGAVLVLVLGISGVATVGAMLSNDAMENVAKLQGDQVLEQRVEKRLYEARMHFWIALSSGDQKHWGKAGEGFGVSDEWLTELLNGTADAELKGKAQKLSELVKAYRKLANKLRFVQQSNGSLTPDEVKAATADATKIEDVMTKAGEELAVNYKNAAEAAKSAARIWAFLCAISSSAPAGPPSPSASRSRFSSRAASVCRS